MNRQRYEAAVGRLLRRLDDFDRDAHRAIQTLHRPAYNELLLAARQVHEAMQADEEPPRKLDGEAAPQYAVAADWPGEKVTL